MARPKKYYRFKRNANSIILYEDGKCLGNFSLKFLCRLKKAINYFGTDKVLAQDLFIKKTKK